MTRVAALLLLSLVACDGRDVTGPDRPCTLPALPSGFNAPHLETTEVRAAVLDAQSRLTTALTDSDPTIELRSSLGTLAQRISVGGDAACRALEQSLSALTRYEADQPGENATLPDRSMVRITLILASAVLRQ